MNAPKAEANKSMAEVEKTAVSLSGILNVLFLWLRIKVDSVDGDYVQCGLSCISHIEIHGAYDT